MVNLVIEYSVCFVLCGLEPLSLPLPVPQWSMNNLPINSSRIVRVLKSITFYLYFLSTTGTLSLATLARRNNLYLEE